MDGGGWSSIDKCAPDRVDINILTFGPLSFTTIRLSDCPARNCQCYGSEDWHCIHNASKKKKETTELALRLSDFRIYLHTENQRPVPLLALKVAPWKQNKLFWHRILSDQDIDIRTTVYRGKSSKNVGFIWHSTGNQNIHCSMVRLHLLIFSVRLLLSLNPSLRKTKALCIFESRLGYSKHYDWSR